MTHIHTSITKSYKEKHGDTCRHNVKHVHHKENHILVMKYYTGTHAEILPVIIRQQKDGKLQWDKLWYSDSEDLLRNTCGRYCVRYLKVMKLQGTGINVNIVDKKAEYLLKLTVK